MMLGTTNIKFSDILVVAAQNHDFSKENKSEITENLSFYFIHSWLYEDFPPRFACHYRKNLFIF